VSETVWRVVDTGFMNGFENMAVDEAIMQAYSAGSVFPTLRFYRWRPACLSLGYFQKIEEEVNLEACRQMGIDVVRRMTGGRAILHDAELTYSIVIEENNPLVSGNVVESYRKISLALVEGLRLLSIDADLAPEVAPAAIYHGAPGTNGAEGALGSSACFDAPCSYELVSKGKKLVGSAQTRSRGLLLQHGSILLDFDAARLVATFKMPEEDRADLAEKIHARATSIKEASGRIPSHEDLRGALVAGFEKQFGITLTPQNLSTAEKNSVAELAVEKYRSRNWNFKR
jgi:lipoyl(octanoyl) transferase